MTDAAHGLPFVSVVIPCRDELRFVGQFLDSVLANDYPKDRLELLLVDGMSEDGTRDVVRRYADACPQLRLMDNPRGTKPAALNIGIRQARGDIIVRLDVHAWYEPSYLTKCVRGLLEHAAADNVGGVIRAEAADDTLIARAIALATTHWFGAGNSRYRIGATEPRWVESVFCGCYRRRVFDEIGLFNEKLIRAQDREFNQRLRDAGGKVLLLPDIHCIYYPRSDLRRYSAWIFEAGYWPYKASRLAQRWMVSWRNLVPPGFVLTLIIGAVLAVVTPVAGIVLAATLAAYGWVALLVAARLAWRHREPLLLPAMVLVFAATHVIYGLGALSGMLGALNAPDRADAAQRVPT